METARLIKENLQQGRVMQVATEKDGQPWICTVYYVADGQQNLYWLSLPDRRHSTEIAANGKVAAAIPVKLDKPVIGIQAEGRAEVVSDIDDIKRVMKLYTGKYGAGKDFYDNFVAGRNRHVLYRFVPNKFVLFDEIHFDSSESRQEWSIF